MNEESTTSRTMSTHQIKFQQDYLVLGDSDLFQKIWRKSVPVPDASFLCNLKSLILEECDFLSNATIPSHLLPSLTNLQELQVRNCNSVKAIFNQTKMKINMTSIGLKKLVLEKLPILEHVWNEDPLENLSVSFPFLEEVFVDECESIKSLFPASVKINRLQILHVEKCYKLAEIFAKVAQELINGKLLPSITSLKLWNLPNLRSVYAGIDILIWPKLEELDILHCQMIEFFSADIQKTLDSLPKGQEIFPTSQKPFVSLAKVTPCLKLLSLSEKEVMMIKKGKLYIDLPELDSLNLQGFNDGSDVFAFAQILESTPPPSIENLVVVCSTFNKIFPSKVSNYHRMSKLLSKFKGLKLQSLPQLQSIGLEPSWMEYFVGELETIFVKECNCLTNLTPFDTRVSFSNLRELKVEDCLGLEYLFSISTAKSFRVLKKLHVTNCGSLQNIVANENKIEGVSVSVSITFVELRILTLTLLPKLESFYSGCSTLNFPSLKKVLISECYNMKAFCSGEAVTEELKVTIDGVCLEGDLNNMLL